MIYPGYVPREGVDPLIMHYGIRFNVSNWHFAKSEHREDIILDDCNRLFPAPPHPEEVNFSASMIHIQIHFLDLGLQYVVRTKFN